MCGQVVICTYLFNVHQFTGRFTEIHLYHWYLNQLWSRTYVFNNSADLSFFNTLCQFAKVFLANYFICGFAKIFHHQHFPLYSSANKTGPGLDTYVTEFAKKSLIHASNFSSLRLCNSACVWLTGLKFVSMTALSSHLYDQNIWPDSSLINKVTVDQVFDPKSIQLWNKMFCF